MYYMPAYIIFFLRMYIWWNKVVWNSKHYSCLIFLFCFKRLEPLIVIIGTPHRDEIGTPHCDDWNPSSWWNPSWWLEPLIVMTGTLIVMIGTSRCDDWNLSSWWLEPLIVMIGTSHRDDWNPWLTVQPWAPCAISQFEVHRNCQLPFRWTANVELVICVL